MLNLFSVVSIGDVDQSLFWGLMTIILFVLVVTDLIIRIIASFRRNPPLDKEIDDLDKGLNKELKNYRTTDECEKRCQKADERFKGVAKANAVNGERINEIEKKQAAADATVTSIDQRLSRMELKLDRVLEGKKTTC